MDRQAEGKRLTFSQKWGDDPFTQSGHTQVPNALIAYAHRLGLRSEECWLITCILRFKYDSSDPTPSQERLAKLFGQSVDTVQRTIRKIVEKKLLKVERIRDGETHRYTHTVYDFTPLRFALNECHYQENPDERPQMPTPLERDKATPQKCGLAEDATHTAEMRPGFLREPHRRSAAWSTPQICGVHIENKKNINEQEERALNVRGSEGGALPEERTTHNGRSVGINAIRDRAVQEIVSLTGDEGSRRRFEQLWEIAEREDALPAWTAAQRALKRRLKSTAQPSLERPGAYFDTICIKELEKCEVFVPTTAERQAEAEVAETVRRGLFEPRASEPSRIALEAPEELPVRSQPQESPEGLADSLARLEREGGASLEAFEGFVAAHRQRYRDELSGMGQTARDRLLSAFERPEKRRDLFRQWSVKSVIETENIRIK